MKTAHLSEVAEINPRLPKALKNSCNGEVCFLPMEAVSESGTVVYQERRRINEVLKGYTHFRRGDLIIAKITPCMENGKAAFLDKLETDIGFGSTEFHVVRPSERIDGRFLFYLLWNPYFRHIAEKRMTGSAGQKRVPASFLKELEVPIPPIEEQRRIAAILDKADAVRRKRGQALTLADDFLRSAFLEMFGDPVNNPQSLSKKCLGDVSTFTSGGTPSKSNPTYWDGIFPWVSPKDMKTTTITDAEDHVNEVVFDETSLKKIPEGAVLIVVRGMILAHTVPIAITGAKVAINQDMKAIQFFDGVAPFFGLWNLKVQHAYILSKVGTAAHGTRRLDMESLKSLPILLPTESQQKHFSELTRSFTRYRNRILSEQAEANTLFASLIQRAFRGDL